MDRGMDGWNEANAYLSPLFPFSAEVTNKRCRMWQSCTITVPTSPFCSLCIVAIHVNNISLNQQVWGNSAFVSLVGLL